jgi:hypothetical protein
LRFVASLLAQFRCISLCANARIDHGHADVKPAILTDP